MNQDEFNIYCDACETLRDGITDSLSSGQMDSTIVAVSDIIGEPDSLSMLYLYDNTEDGKTESKFSL
jgi:hypothetical protein